MSEKEVFIKIIQENEALIHKVARVYTSSREEEQDLYQEIIYQLWKAFASFRNDSKISTWMYRIALNTSIAHLNKEKRKGKRVDIDEELLNRSDTEDTLGKERLAMLYAHIRKLDTIEKGIILLYLEGRPYEEIAVITGFTITNVATRLSRIKQKLTAQIIPGDKHRHLSK